MNKNQMRLNMLKLRANQNPSDKIKRDQNIVNQIVEHPKFIKAKTVALFYPTKDEVNLLALLKFKKTFLFPKVEEIGLDFHTYTKETIFQKSSFGILEPKGNNIHHKKIDLMLVPALAISLDKHRIGYGKAYYDRYIASHDIGYKIGVINDFQEVEQIESSPHDQKLDEYIKGSL